MEELAVIDRDAPLSRSRHPSSVGKIVAPPVIRISLGEVIMRLLKTMSVVGIACLGMASSHALAEPAVVIKAADQSGGAFDGDGNLVIVLCDTMLVETSSKTGVITTTCRARGVPNESGRAVRYDVYNNPFYWSSGAEVPCGFLTADGQLVLTNEWTETLSASGNMVFRCRAKIN